MLVFFDIDATMITTGGVGINAMVDAGAELFGAGFRADGVEFAGRLDPLILVDLLARNGQAPTAANLSRMRDGYRRHLDTRLRTGVGRVLPGVTPLLARLAAHKPTTLGVLTGNFPDTGSMKLAACGIDVEVFSIRVWGDESPYTPPAREHLPPVGMQKYAARTGSATSPDRVVIIGDTPHDVSCAKAHGCRSLGVATGKFSTQQLVAAGADMAVPTLSETEAIAAWITRGAQG
jgi:phosphoglycolate phosphatase-like HAD superfamily hydrolase